MTVLGAETADRPRDRNGADLGTEAPWGPTAGVRYLLPAPVQPVADTPC